ncbi:MAG TPA: ComEC/Rec2 family competence protein [Methylomirabilota bacterium]|nr:ComEC/Rec2 family competence protein [Methylomirabilota bacterium]
MSASKEAQGAAGRRSGPTPIFVLKRPMLPIVMGFALGILVADATGWKPGPLLGAALALNLLALVWIRGRPWLLLPLTTLAGAAALAVDSVPLDPADLRFHFTKQAELVTLRGRLLETPELRIHDRHGEERSRSLARLKVTSFQRGREAWRRGAGLVIVSTPGPPAPGLFRGREVEVRGVLRRPDGPVAEGLFDYRRHLRRLGIHHQLITHGPGDWNPVGGPKEPGWSDRFNAWARRTLALGLPEEDEALRLRWAMTLGWKTGLAGEVAEPFMRSGTTHIFAISGLHVALISGILVGLLRVTGMPRGHCGWIVIPLLWGYTAATGWQASAIRSTIMMTVVIAGWAMHRPSDLLNSLAAAAIFILAWSPQQLFQAGFQLSFVVVAALALLEPAARRMRQKLLRTDPLLPRELMPTWKRAGHAAAGALVNSATTSLAAWIGSVPLIAGCFHLLTPVSVVASMVIVPLSACALASDLASLLTGAWWPWLAGVFNHGAWFWMRAMMGLSAWFAAWPGAWRHVAAPSPALLLLYYGAVLAVAAGWPLKERHRRTIGAGLALAAAVWLAQAWAAGATARLCILPLHGGSALLYEPGGADGGRPLLIDCGNDPSVEHITSPFLAARGFHALPEVILTHGDAAHVAGLSRLAHEFRPGTLGISAVEFRSPAYHRVVADWQAAGHAICTLGTNEFRPGWRVLHPHPTDGFALADDGALVLEADIGGIRVLSLSDLGRTGQNTLLHRHPDLKADIVIAGLPGEGEPLADALIETLAPRLIVITDAEYPAKERASARLRARLEAHSAPVLYTRETGAITLEWRERHCAVRTASGVRIPLASSPSPAHSVPLAQ